ncbi:bifunctional adenosylcobinamide kinase/adenosylcobinamide-phosphate guanylyltransferase [Neptunomonas concharum]|uniref:Bifunctional adenosylcobalamin biosynthesis protein n=1 Tax=Neptunomonas concharum TaxID=1031538 RepID=A0A5P1RAW5_9GAMM|nr:bifunctional adenosylcobinamide kinase/adenosylcobinamide-phosphate guanylyltransferase [Neptunomonas concharum]QEQ96743.1 bifunctional adenosylcobinamide kinase/adenosylcobinamide-phosphate guanylyltransferase [Neptunomonas concharum]
MIRLILGGARSGKSRYAEQIASASQKPVCYVATAKAQDTEMQARIEHHRQSRPPKWQTREVPIHLGEVLSDNNLLTYCILVDCLTLWVTNLLCEGENIAESRSDLLATLQRLQAQPDTEIILVSNETGLGVVPMGELTRRYVDEAGWLHQSLAEIADEVILMVAGIPVPIKPRVNNL